MNVPPLPGSGNHEISYSTVRGAKDARRPTPVHSTWRNIRRQCTEPDIRLAKDGPAWIFATFGNCPNDKGNFRINSNVTRVTALVLDLDGKCTSYTAKELKTRLEGIAFVAHTTYTSTRERRKWRVIFPLAAPIAAELLPAAFAYLDERFKLERDTACSNPARIFYLPACPPDRRDEFEAISGVGEFLDARDIPARKSTPDNPPATPSNPPSIIESNRESAIGNVSHEHSNTVRTVLLCSFPPSDIPESEPKRADSLEIPSNLGDAAALIPLDVVVRTLQKDRGLSLRLAERLGLPVEALNRGELSSESFCSPLPWRKEINPSCVLVAKDGSVVLHDHGDTHEKTYSVEQFAVHKSYGRYVAPGEMRILPVLWTLRLLIEAGILAPAPVPELPPCPDTATEVQRRVYDGFRLLLQCKGRVAEWAGQPTMFSREFAAAWCGLRDAADKRSDATVVRAIAYLQKTARVIHICGRHGPSCVWAPGPYTGTPAPCSPTANKLLPTIRRILATLGIDTPPEKLTAEQRAAILAQLRVSPSMPKGIQRTDGFLFAGWADTQIIRKGGRPKGKSRAGKGRRNSPPDVK